MNILILGSLPKDPERTRLYEDMISVCQKYGEVSSPIDTAKFKGSEKERFDRAVRKVREADLIIGEQSKASTGQGIELGIAYMLEKKMIVVSSEPKEVSGLVKSIAEVIIYNHDLIEKLDAALSEMSGA